MLFSWQYKRSAPLFLATYKHFVHMSLERTSSSIFIWDVQVCCIHVLKIGWEINAQHTETETPIVVPLGLLVSAMDLWSDKNTYYLLNIPTTFCSNWSSGSREEGRYIQLYRLWRRTQSDDNTPTLLSGSNSNKKTFFTVDSLVLHNKNICFICASHLIPMNGMRAKPILMV